ncbi:hypothetical protein BGZ73_008233 [Actinomortierella ambigua]|nr:hypothetical protein BGZ73_008233 [Actinomortierella ambigua]
MSILVPSALQREFIPPILQGRDVLIRDTTGSGKTFGVLVSLLSKPRVMIPLDIKKQLKGRRSAVRPGITSVFIVPNQELAFQLLDWTKQLLPDLISNNEDNHHDQLDALIQVLTASSSDTHEAQVAKLAKTLPHVLVATPSRLWTLLEQGVLDLSMIETLVLDEVDHLIRIPGRYATQQQLANRDMHPKPAELAVREILRSARALGRYPLDTAAADNKEVDDNAGGDSTLSPESGAEVAAMKKEIEALEQVIADRRSNNNGTTSDSPAPKKRAKSKTDILQKRIQLIASSATMNRTVRHWLLTNQWIREPAWVDLTKSVVLPHGIQHYCLIIGHDSIRNMKQEADPYQAGDRPAVPKLVAGQGKAKDDEEDDDDEDEDDQRLRQFEDDDDDDDDEDEEQYQDWAATDLEWQDAERKWQQQQLEKAETGHQRVPATSQSFTDDDDRMLESVVNACALEGASTACVFFCNQPSLRKISERFEHQFEFPVKLIQDAYQQQDPSLANTANKRVETPLPTTTTASSSSALTNQPSVFIANEANARGLDLPNVSHVIVVGLPSCPSSYLHMAGRTGRFGKQGKVVTLLRDEGRIEDRARTLFKTLQVNIERFPHVE